MLNVCFINPVDPAAAAGGVAMTTTTTKTPVGRR